MAPGLMATENALDDLPRSLVDQFVGELQLVHRLGRMDDVVSAVLLLCSEGASFVTGDPEGDRGDPEGERGPSVPLSN